MLRALLFSFTGGRGPTIPRFSDGGNSFDIRCLLVSSLADSSRSGSINDSNESKSKRRQFKETPVNPSILRHIQMIGVGIPPRPTKRNKNKSRRVLLPTMTAPRSRSRRRLAATDGPTDEDQTSRWKPPPPFGPHSAPVKIIASVDSVDDYSGFPENRKSIPEVALAGRSNVGKSTLLNALLYGNRKNTNDTSYSCTERRHRRNLATDTLKLPKGVKATTSPRPGETRSITFYQLATSKSKQKDANDEEEKKRKSQSGMLWCVDLPGYGFAYVKEQDAAKFRQLISKYLLYRGKNLKRVLMLLDARHGMKKADVDFLDMLQQQEQLIEHEQHSPRRLRLPPIQLVLTKCDLVSQEDLARRVVLVRQQLSDCLRRELSQLPIMLVSVRAGVGLIDTKSGRAKGGILELQKELASLVRR